MLKHYRTGLSAMMALMVPCVAMTDSSAAAPSMGPPVSEDKKIIGWASDTLD